MVTSNPELEAFQEKMELAYEISKNKSKAGKAKRQNENVAKRQNMVRSLQRAQRYLGLAPRNEDSLLPNAAHLSISPFDYDKLPKFAFDLDVVFISIDVEAYEKPPRQITEVGVATLDVRDLRASEQGPGKAGEVSISSV